MRTSGRPLWMIGLGEGGLRLAARVLTMAAADGEPPPWVHGTALAVAAPTASLPPGLQVLPGGLELTPPTEAAWLTQLEAELGTFYRVEHHTGRLPRSSAGVSAVLVAALEEPVALTSLIPLARLLQRLAERRPVRSFTLMGMLLLPAEPAGAAATLRQLAQGGWLAGAAPGFPFDDGCYLLDQMNELGLALASATERETVAARWCLELATGPLGAALATLPWPAEGPLTFRSLGVASWELPTAALAVSLGRRWQRWVLGAWLAPAEPPPAPAESLAPWPSPAGPPFQATWARWRHLAPGRLAALLAELDTAVAAEQARLAAWGAAWEQELDSVARRGAEAALTEVRAALETPARGALTRGGQVLGAALAAAHRSVQQAAAEHLRLESARRAQATQSGQARARLAALLADLPPWALRTWAGWLYRPWRALAWWQAYQECERQAAAYLAECATAWQLAVQSRVAAYQAALYTQIAGRLAEEGERLAALRTGLEQRCVALAPPPEEEAALTQPLAAAALPADLPALWYTQAVAGEVGELAAVQAAVGSLAVAWAQEQGAAWLSTALEEAARERFDFLAALRLDELLVHTVTGVELRARLGALLDAARPLLLYDEAALTPEEREAASRWVWLGLPQAEDSLLPDLVPERGVQSYSTGRQAEVLAVQVRVGLPLRAVLDVGDGKP